MGNSGSGEGERLVLGLNPSTLQCDCVVISGRELHAFSLSFPKDLGLILSKQRAEELGWCASLFPR